MFDTMTATKIVGGFCGTLLVFLLGGWAADMIYHVNIEAHGDEEREQAYVIEVEDTAAGEEEAEEEVPFEELLAAADPSDGQSVFRQCASCHNADTAQNATGPHLVGVVGRPKASVDGFNYSAALTDMSGEEWTPDNLNHFLESPRGYAPGTTMTFNGLSDPEDRAAVVAYLDSIEG